MKLSIRTKFTLALVFNEMAEKLSEKKQNITLTIKEDSEKE
jgi:hypothetical protein